MTGALALMLLAAAVLLLGGFGWLILEGRHQRRDAIESRFVARGTLTANFTATTVDDLKRREREAFARHAVGGTLDTAQFEVVAGELGLRAAVLVDDEGRALQVWPAQPALIGTNLADRYEHISVAVAGNATASNVVPSAAKSVPIVAFAVPIDGPAGRVVFSGGFDATNTPIATYLQDTVTRSLAGSHAYLVDANGMVIADSIGVMQVSKPLTDVAPRLTSAIAQRSKGQIDAADGNRFFTVAAVRGTPWRVVVTVPTAQLYAASDGPALDVAWFVLGGLCLATGIAGALVVVVRRRSRKLALANTRLEAKTAEVEDLLVFEQQFVARSSHELRTPLTSVIGYVEEVLEGDDPLSEEQRSCLDVTLRNAHRLHALVNDLLLLNETQTTNLHLESRTMPMSEFLREPIEEYAMLCERSGLRFDADVPDLTLWPHLDPARTEQILTNLVSNAMKFTPAGGAIGLRVREGDEEILVEVWDTGMGIAPDEINEVFERFFRSSSADKRKVPGTGLGLAIARSMAESQGGSLVVASRVGVGTVFTLAIPAVAQPIAVATGA